MTHPAPLTQIKEFIDEFMRTAQHLKLTPRETVLACGMFAGTVSNALVDDGAYTRAGALDALRDTFNEGMALMIHDINGDDIVTNKRTVQ